MNDSITYADTFSVLMKRAALPAGALPNSHAGKVVAVFFATEHGIQHSIHDDRAIQTYIDKFMGTAWQ
jgi:hypothetical protein